MEERIRLNPKKIANRNPPFQVHSVAAPLRNSPSTNFSCEDESTPSNTSPPLRDHRARSSTSPSPMGIFHNLMKSSSDCMCFSMDTSAVVHAQVISVKHEKLRGSNMHTDDSVVDYRLDSKAKHASVLKRGFSGPSICKRYARVSDVSDSKRQETLLIADANDNGVEKDETADEEVQREQTGGDDHDESLHRAYRLSTKDYSSVRKLMQNYHPTVRYTYEPCMAFYESMMETIKVGCVEGYEYLDLADMFTCYLMLNSSQHHRHIEEAFRLLLRELYIFAET